MRHIFSKLRHKLIGSSSGRYMLYAMGEILLVMIGILLALQVNNWNEERKESQFERKIYEELVMSINRNISQLEEGVIYSKRSANSCRIILSHLETDLPYSDTLDRHFTISLRWWHPSLGNQAYESLKNHYGLHLLKNDTIRNLLGSLNEMEWMNFMITQQEDFFSNTMGPLLPDLFQEYSVERDMKPYDYNELKKSKNYRFILRTSLEMRERQIRWYEGVARARENVVAMIRQELNR